MLSVPMPVWVRVSVTVGAFRLRIVRPPGTTRTSGKLRPAEGPRAAAGAAAADCLAGAGVSKSSELLARGAAAAAGAGVSRSSELDGAAGAAGVGASRSSELFAGTRGLDAGTGAAGVGASRSSELPAGTGGRDTGAGGRTAGAAGADRTAGGGAGALDDECSRGGRFPEK